MGDPLQETIAELGRETDALMECLQGAHRQLHMAVFAIRYRNKCNVDCRSCQTKPFGVDCTLVEKGEIEMRRIEEALDHARSTFSACRHC